MFAKQQNKEELLNKIISKTKWNLLPVRKLIEFEYFGVKAQDYLNSFKDFSKLQVSITDVKNYEFDSDRVIIGRSYLLKTVIHNPEIFKRKRNEFEQFTNNLFNIVSIILSLNSTKCSKQASKKQFYPDKAQNQTNVAQREQQNGFTDVKDETIMEPHQINNALNQQIHLNQIQALKRSDHNNTPQRSGRAENHKFQYYFEKRYNEKLNIYEYVPVRRNNRLSGQQQPHEEIDQINDNIRKFRQVTDLYQSQRKSKGQIKVDDQIKQKANDEPRIQCEFPTENQKDYDLNMMKKMDDNESIMRRVSSKVSSQENADVILDLENSQNSKSVKSSEDRGRIENEHPQDMVPSFFQRASRSIPLSAEGASQSLNSPTTNNKVRSPDEFHFNPPDIQSQIPTSIANNLMSPKRNSQRPILPRKSFLQTKPSDQKFSVRRFTSLLKPSFSLFVSKAQQNSRKRNTFSSSSSMTPDISSVSKPDESENTSSLIQSKESIHKSTVSGDMQLQAVEPIQRDEANKSNILNSSLKQSQTLNQNTNLIKKQSDEAIHTKSSITSVSSEEDKVTSNLKSNNNERKFTITIVDQKQQLIQEDNYNQREYYEALKNLQNSNFVQGVNMKSSRRGTLLSMKGSLRRSIRGSIRQANYHISKKSTLEPKDETEPKSDKKNSENPEQYESTIALKINIAPRIQQMQAFLVQKILDTKPKEEPKPVSVPKPTQSKIRNWNKQK